MIDVAERPTYTAAEAARYTGTSAATVARWRAGYTYRTQRGPRRSSPVTGGEPRGLLTFSELLEVAVVVAARDAGLSMKAIRRGVNTARDLYGVERPLSLMRFKHDGQSLFSQDALLVQRAGQRSGFVNLSRSGQVAWEHIDDVLKDIDYESDVALRWWPAGRDQLVVIDPRVSFGRPYVVRRGVSTDAVAGRFRAKEPLASIAEDLDLTTEEVEAALRFELPQAA